MSEKVYCQNCCHCEKFMSGDSAGCGAIKEKPKRNEYINKLVGVTVRVKLSENENGDCSYYEPILSYRIKRKIKALLS